MSTARVQGMPGRWWRAGRIVAVAGVTLVALLTLYRGWQAHAAISSVQAQLSGRLPQNARIVGTDNWSIGFTDIESFEVVVYELDSYRDGVEFAAANVDPATVVTLRETDVAGTRRSPSAPATSPGGSAGAEVRNQAVRDVKEATDRGQLRRCAGDVWRGMRLRQPPGAQYPSSVLTILVQKSDPVRVVVQWAEE
jgi:hypothetical protein